MLDAIHTSDCSTGFALAGEPQAAWYLSAGGFAQCSIAVAAAACWLRSYCCPCLSCLLPLSPKAARVGLPLADLAPPCNADLVSSCTMVSITFMIEHRQSIVTFTERLQRVNEYIVLVSIGVGTCLLICNSRECLDKLEVFEQAHMKQHYAQSSGL